MHARFFSKLAGARNSGGEPNKAIAERGHQKGWERWGLWSNTIQNPARFKTGDVAPCHCYTG